jgi:adenylate cyclase
MSIAALLAASVVVVAIVAFAVFWAWPRLWPQAPAGGERGSAAAVAELAPRLSIVVVLPFVNLSSDPEQEYFADGITDDLTTDLSRIGGSFVIARTTAFTYKGKATGIK